MQTNYNVWLVALSVGVAMLASYTAFVVSARISGVTMPLRRHAWLLGGAVSTGCGIWSMHFLGMLALALPIPVEYDVALMCYSLLIAIGASFVALYLVTRPGAPRPGIVLGGIVLGAGIAAMHYTGMAAMQMRPPIEYQSALVALSIVVGMVAVSAALWLGHPASGSGRRAPGRRLAAAALLGLAISAVHYLGMAAAHLAPHAVCAAAHGLSPQWLAPTITLTTLGLLIFTLILSRYDASTTRLLSSVTRLNGQLVRLATFDSLTDLPNRGTLVESIKWAIDRARRGELAFAILFINLDGFKTINDSLGHSAGDRILKTCAGRLRECVRDSDMVARLGGDEFAILLDAVRAPREAEAMAETVIERMRDGLSVDAVPLRVTASIGIVLYPGDGDEVETLLKNADAAMSVSKQAGRNTYRFFEASMNEAATRMMDIRLALDGAATNGYLSLQFQPKFDGVSGQLAGAEALLRLDHPTLGSVAPLEFIPVAERSGQIIEIGYWVVREACRQMRRWRQQGVAPVKIAINLSPMQLLQPDLVINMRDIALEAEVPVEQLMFEMTEAVAMQDAIKTAEIMDEFRRYGFDIAVDHFGTAFSSLAHLQRFRFKQLKIDRFFTSGLDADGEEGKAIVAAIIGLAHALNMDVVAEGVESASQLAKLKSMHVDQVQGYLLARPLDATAFTDFIRASTEPPAAA